MTSELWQTLMILGLLIIVVLILYFNHQQGKLNHIVVDRLRRLEDDEDDRA